MSETSQPKIVFYVVWRVVEQEKKNGKVRRYKESVFTSNVLATDVENAISKVKKQHNGKGDLTFRSVVPTDKVIDIV